MPGRWPRGIRSWSGTRRPCVRCSRVRSPIPPAGGTRPPFTTTLTASTRLRRLPTCCLHQTNSNVSGHNANTSPGSLFPGTGCISPSSSRSSRKRLRVSADRATGRCLTGITATTRIRRRGCCRLLFAQRSCRTAHRTLCASKREASA